MQKKFLDKAQMIQWLGDVIRTETEKSDGEMDITLVMECDAYLAELLSDVPVSDEQMRRNIARIKNQYVPATVIAPHARHYPRRLVAAICAAAFLLGGCLTACAFVPAFRNMICAVLCDEGGNSLRENGVTFTHAGKTTDYPNIDTLIKSESLDILYPHDLPETMQIKYIVSSGNGDFSIGFVDQSTSIVIYSICSDTPPVSTVSEEFVNSHGIISYILVRGKTVVSTTMHNGWAYYITAPTVEDIKTILENLY